jgi:glycosyltransferase involved in cell wall biosynthesis
VRVAVVASLVGPLREAQLGGAQAFQTDLARALAARGHEVTVFCAEGSALDGLRLETVPAPAGVERALVKPAGRPPPSLPGLRPAFAELFARVCARGCEVISLHAFDAEALEEAVERAVPVLHTLHLPPLVPALVERVRAVAGRPRARFVTVSEAMRRAWSAVGLHEVEVIPDGVPVFDLSEVPVAPRAVVAGRVSPEKGTAVAMRVARRAGLEPLVVGGVYDRAYWRRRVRIPVRPVTRPELWRLMAASAVTLMPVEWEEPFGLVAAESQMAGCPVVGYRRGGLPEVVPQGVGGFLVEPGDERALVDAVGQALRLDRASVRRWARERLGIGPVAAAYEAALAALAGER